MTTEQPPPKEPIGQVFKRAGLLSEAQVQIALMDQAQYAGTLFGEIVVMRGWIKPETLAFFLNTILPTLQAAQPSQTPPSTSAPQAEDLSQYASVQAPAINRRMGSGATPKATTPQPPTAGKTTAQPQKKQAQQSSKKAGWGGLDSSLAAELRSMRVEGYEVGSEDESEMLLEQDLSEDDLKKLL
ncbi:MAG: hypothetical protein NW237_08735 [Cyanobacteriota bacterium]|nr:hypothetical protein [Cyanobacteriota bacterium]